jgi:hypothetical protein
MKNTTETLRTELLRIVNEGEARTAKLVPPISPQLRAMYARRANCIHRKMYVVHLSQGSVTYCKDCGAEVRQ